MGGGQFLKISNENSIDYLTCIEKKGKNISLESLTHSTEDSIDNLKQEVGVGRLSFVSV